MRLLIYHFPSMICRDAIVFVSAKAAGDELRQPSLRDALHALDWARREMMRKGSPDFVRERFAEQRVQKLVAKLLRG